MKTIVLRTLLLLAIPLFTGCKRHEGTTGQSKSHHQNVVRFAKGFAIYPGEGYSVLVVKDPWPNAAKVFTYILQEKTTTIPDSLQQFPIIKVPLKSIVVTSTTHIPCLELLGVENTLIGFPHTNYVSSQKSRDLIDQEKIKEIGTEQGLNTELVIELAPNAIVGHGVDNNNPTFDNLEKSGLPVLYNGDWNEATPLGKAEWIKFFGALYGKLDKAETIFNSIEQAYQKTKQIAAKAKTKPTVFSGAIFQNQWFMPQGNSWGAQFLKDAKGDYLWSDTKGTGSLSLSFESVFLKASQADFWIGPGQYNSLSEMEASSTHYAEFKAFQNKQVYSYSIKKGKTGGIIYYELAPNRPDLVLKDIMKILHPELLPDYQLQFFEQLQ